MAPLLAASLALGALLSRGSGSAAGAMAWTDLGVGCCPQIEGFMVASLKDVQLKACQDECLSQGEECGFISFNSLYGDCNISMPSLRCALPLAENAMCRATHSYRFGPDRDLEPPETDGPTPRPPRGPQGTSSVPRRFSSSAWALAQRATTSRQVPQRPTEGDQGAIQVPRRPTDADQGALLEKCECGGKTCSESVLECVGDLATATGSNKPHAPLADGETREGACRKVVEMRCGGCKYCLNEQPVPAEKFDARPGGALARVPGAALAAATLGAVAAAALAAGAALLAGRRAAARGSGGFRAVAAPESDGQAANRGDASWASS